MHFSLLTNHWNCIASDESLALLDQDKKKAMAKIIKRTTFQRHPFESKF